MDNCIKTGAYVHFDDYGAYAPADLFAVGPTRIVRFHGESDFSYTPQRTVTHRLFLNRRTNHWDKRRGIAVVMAEDLEPVPAPEPLEVEDVPQQ